jgi:hypothetical protein
MVPNVSRRSDQMALEFDLTSKFSLAPAPCGEASTGKGGQRGSKSSVHTGPPRKLSVPTIENNHLMKLTWKKAS